MKLRSFVISVVLMVALFLFAQRRTDPPKTPEFSSIVDLTHTAGTKSPTYEAATTSPFTARDLSTIDKDGYFAREIALPEHFSTHIDAPAHFARGRWTVDQIPAARLIAPLVVIDITPKVRVNPDYRLESDDIGAWEKANGNIPAGAVVMARTGWGTRWDTAKEYRNPDPQGTLHFPGFSVEAAQFLVEARNVVGLGID